MAVYSPQRLQQGRVGGQFRRGPVPNFDNVEREKLFDAQCGGPGLRIAMRHGIFDRPMQCHLKAHQLLRIGGAKIDGGLRGFGNRVHAGAAAYGAQVQRRARIVGQRNIRERRQRRSQCGNRVGQPGIGKTMAARPVDRYLEAPAAQGQRYGRVRACSVKHDVSSDAAGQRRLAIEMAHSAQVAFTLFTHIPQKDERRRQFDLCLEQSVGNGQHADHTGAIVASARSGEAIAFENWIKRRVRGKHRVEMGREDHERPGALRRQIGSWQQRVDISNFVGFHMAQPSLGKAEGEPFRAHLFAKRRRGNRHHLRLPGHDLLRIAVQPRKGRMDRPLCSQRSYAREG